jgi:carbonic anhydrase
MRLAALPLLLLPLPAFAQDTHYEYDGPEGPAAWAELNADWATCGSGHAQSPIDLAGAHDGEVEDLHLDWTPGGDWRVINTGHTIQAAPVDGSAGTLTIGGVPYDLVQFHFHHPSEHAVDGARTEAEVHFVHSSAEGALAVVGVMLVGGGEAGPFDAVMAAAPDGLGEAEGGTLDIATLLPEDGHFYRYTGSLTTPPCSEGVTWTVMTEPVAVSDEALAAFAALYPNDARPLQDLGDREVLSH